jgi:ankyrin repeat protein
MQIKQELECFEGVTSHAVLACFLIKNGADVFLQNDAGITALQGLPIEVSAIAASYTQKHQVTVAS